MAKQSDHPHIDDLFRQKEDAFMPDTSNLPVQLQQMKTIFARHLLQQFYSQLEKETQAFVIAANQDHVLVTPEGARLHIPANCFTGKTGIVKGNINIQLQEFYDYPDMVAARLSTTSYNRQLVTGGMLYIKAMADGEEVMIAPRKTINLTIPCSQLDEEMMLFTGTWSQQDQIINDKTTINWMPAGQVQTMSYGPQLIKILSMNNQVEVTIDQRKKTTAVFQIGQDITLTDKEIKQNVQKLLGAHFDVIKFNRAQTTAVQLNLSSKGLPQNIDLKNITLSKAVELLFGKKEDLYIRHSGQFGSKNNMHKTGSNNYRFKIKQTGWINCDRYMDVCQPNISMSLQPGEGFDAAVFVAQLVFTRCQSIIYGEYTDNRIRFHNFPENEPMQLICIGVKEGKVVVCSKPVTTSTQEIDTLDFKPITPAEFKQDLQALFAPDQTTPGSGISDIPVQPHI
jgi:hypothetical protein